MKILREVSDWQVPTPNHDYAVNDGGKVVAYRRQGKDYWEVFSVPRMFSRSRRKFKTLKSEQDLNYFISIGR